MDEGVLEGEERCGRREQEFRVANKILFCKFCRLLVVLQNLLEAFFSVCVVQKASLTLMLLLTLTHQRPKDRPEYY